MLEKVNISGQKPKNARKVGLRSVFFFDEVLYLINLYFSFSWAVIWAINYKF